MYIYVCIYAYICKYLRINTPSTCVNHNSHTQILIQDDLVFADHTLPRCVYWEGKLYPLPGTLQDAPFFQVCFRVSVYWCCVWGW